MGLVYILMGLCGLAIGVAGYFAVALTPVEAGFLAILVTLIAVVVHEHRLRRRAERRLGKGIEELGKLLSTDAKAGQVLTQRVNALAKLDVGARLDVVEADVSVLGTVVRQVAEAVSELETTQAARKPAPASAASVAPVEDVSAAIMRQLPAIPLPALRSAMDEGRILFNAQPIVTLPQRKMHAYQLAMRLVLDGRKIADPEDYMPARSSQGDIVLRRIERGLVDEAVRIVRKARLGSQPVRVLTPISLATLSDKAAIDQLIGVLAANRATNADLCLLIDHADFNDMGRLETELLNRLVQQGITFGLTACTSLRFDFAALADRGVRYIAVDAEGFLANPSRYSDFHASDINDYIARFGINFVVTGIGSEQQVLALLDDDIKLAQGNAIAPLGPLRQDLRDTDTQDDLLRLASN